MRKLIITLFTAIAFQAAVMAQQLPIVSQKGQNIYGIISKTDKTGKHGVAIVSHGFNGSHHFAKDYFDTLNSLGYDVYTFDFPCGSTYSLSDNNTMNMSLVDEKETLKHIVGYFRRQKDIDKKRIVLMGESQGGLASALAAAELKDKVSALVLVYPAFCIPDNWNERYPTDADIPDTTRLWGVSLGRRFFEECRPMDVYGTIGRYRGPVLLIHGSSDPIVPVDYSRRAATVYKNATIKVIDGAGHGFKPQERDVANGYVREFLQK